MMPDGKQKQNIEFAKIKGLNEHTATECMTKIK